MCDCNERHCHFSEEKTIKVRKNHDCEECKNVIAKGQISVRIQGRWDDDYWRGWICLPCNEDWITILNVLSQTEDGACQCYGELEKTLGQAIEDDYLAEDHPLAIKWFGNP